MLVDEMAQRPIGKRCFRQCIKRPREASDSGSNPTLLANRRKRGLLAVQKLNEEGKPKAVEDGKGTCQG